MSGNKGGFLPSLVLAFHQLRTESILYEQREDFCSYLFLNLDSLLLYTYVASLTPEVYKSMKAWEKKRIQAEKKMAAGNPCAAKNPCAANPCAAKNPCGARNPCASKNPCGG